MNLLPDFLAGLRAACAQPYLDPDLWHANTSEDLAEAIGICHTCPLQLPCASWAIDHDERGIWGGLTRGQRRELHKRESHTAQPEPREWIDSDGNIRRPCGTEGAWQQHRIRNETCKQCDTARAHRIETSRRQRLAEAHAVGGTPAGYVTHRRLGEDPCDRCTAAHRRDRRDRDALMRAKRAARRRAALLATPGPHEHPNDAQTPAQAVA